MDFKFLKLWDSNGKLDIAKGKSLIESHPELLMVKDDEGNTLLHWLASENESEGIEAVLYMGADIDAQDSNGCTPLYSTLLNVHRESMEKLLYYGADINLADKFGFTPLHVAAVKCPLKIVELLIARGADPAAVDREGNTPLHVAEALKREGIAEFLRHLDAD